MNVDDVIKAHQLRMGCTCQKIKDIKTAMKWIDEGMKIIKGEKGTKLLKSTLFCRCQVEEASQSFLDYMNKNRSKPLEPKKEMLEEVRHSPFDLSTLDEYFK